MTKKWLEKKVSRVPLLSGGADYTEFEVDGC